MQKKKTTHMNGLFVNYLTVTLPLVAVAASSVNCVDEPVRVIGLVVFKKQLL